MRGSGLLQRNADLSAPENQNRVQGAWPGSWRRSPTSPGRTQAPGTGPGGVGPGGGSRPRASHAAFPRVQALASPKPDSREEAGRKAPRERKTGASRLCVHPPAPGGGFSKEPEWGFRGDSKD